MYGLSLQLD